MELVPGTANSGSIDVISGTGKEINSRSALGFVGLYCPAALDTTTCLNVVGAFAATVTGTVMDLPSGLIEKLPTVNPSAGEMPMDVALCKPSPLIVTAVGPVPMVRISGDMPVMNLPKATPTLDDDTSALLVGGVTGVADSLNTPTSGA